jgi:hypothetical protein
MQDYIKKILTKEGETKDLVNWLIDLSSF